MSVQLQVSQVIDRPVAKVFDFIAREHVHNHPKWDPDIELEQISDGPIGVGTVIRRRNTRSGTPVAGTMEVVEFEPDRTMGVVVHDGPVEMRARLLFEPVGESQTKVTTILDLPDMEEMDTSFILSRLEQSGRRRKELIESEV